MTTSKTFISNVLPYVGYALIGSSIVLFFMETAPLIALAVILATAFAILVYKKVLTIKGLLAVALITLTSLAARDWILAKVYNDPTIGSAPIAIDLNKQLHLFTLHNNPIDQKEVVSNNVTTEYYKIENLVIKKVNLDGPCQGKTLYRMDYDVQRTKADETKEYDKELAKIKGGFAIDPNSEDEIRLIPDISQKTDSSVKECYNRKEASSISYADYLNFKKQHIRGYILKDTAKSKKEEKIGIAM
ncbi:DMT family transporter [TM7 phylum sp. oral taxon 350]|nr:DMT family transporter [TM7 phylum sp. oral taxon 350]